MGALSLSLPADIRNNRMRLSSYVTAYNLGRLLSYAAAGALAGVSGHEALGLLGLDDDAAHRLLRVLGAVFIVVIGLYLGGWLPQVIRLERIGQPLWKKVEPLTRSLMPIKSIYQALLYGMLWGWLPCGLVYMVLLMTVTAGSAVQGASMMLAFGLGTLPAMISAGVMLGWVRRLANTPYSRQVIGVVLVITAIASLFIGVDNGHQHHH